MREAQELLQPAETEPPLRDLELLVRHDRRSRVFLQNFRDLVLPRKLSSIELESAPADFWPDVFVNQRLPWRRFSQSGLYHFLALLAIWEGSQFVALQRPAIARPVFTHADVIYYSPSEYLPPLDTRRPAPANAHKVDPEYSAQPIISVPPEADNRSQTIVAPPNVRLAQEIALPNVVALMQKESDERMPIGPAPAVPASEMSRLAPRMERSVVAPPPVVQAVSRETLQARQAAVIAPPPDFDSATRRVGDLNIGGSTVIAPAPRLFLDEQRTLAGRASPVLSGRSQGVIAPPPALAASGHGRSGESLVALSLHPAIGAPPDPPAGNRRGNFAATPEGHRGASGEAGATSGNSTGGASARNEKIDTGGASKSGASGLPSGLYVGKASAKTSTVAGDPAPHNSSANSVNPRLLANARPPLVSGRTMQPENQTKLSQEERDVFGNRKFYSLSLNMPNLNSSGGSWIIRFAALKKVSDFSYSQIATSNDSTGAPLSENLSAPTAMRKVDPAYPLELMKQNVSGTVILYAVIHADGTVGAVRVLRSVDERLDQFASEAVAKWQFQPATKDGAPVDVEATFWIPFRPTRVGSNF